MAFREITVQEKEAVCPQGHQVDKFLVAVGGIRYCWKCGAELQQLTCSKVYHQCAECLKPINKGMAYCPYCGVKGGEVQ